jgi:hypothetical protein
VIYTQNLNNNFISNALNFSQLIHENEWKLASILLLTFIILETIHNLVTTKKSESEFNSQQHQHDHYLQVELSTHFVFLHDYMNQMHYVWRVDCSLTS